MTETYERPDGASSLWSDIARELHIALAVEPPALNIATDRVFAVVVAHYAKLAKQRRRQHAEKVRKWRTLKKTPPADVIQLPTEANIEFASPTASLPAVIETPPAPTVSVSTVQPRNKRRKTSRPKTPRAGPCVCPDDWQPKPIHVALGETFGMSQDQVMQEAASMRDWSHANAHRPVAKKSNWDQAFNNWLRNHDRRHAPPRPTRPTSSVGQAAKVLAGGTSGFAIGPRPVLRGTG